MTRKFLSKTTLLITLATLPIQLFAQSVLMPLQGKSFFSARSQSVNAARDAAGFHRYINKYDAQSFYGAFSITPAYARAYKTSRIAEYFFGTDCLNISGSMIENRGMTDILADYFGLSQEFSSFVELCPKLQHALVDCALYLGWGPFYIRVHAPYVWQRNEFELIEQINQPENSSTDYPALYMAQLATEPPARSFKQAMMDNLTWGDIQKGLCYGKISCGALTEHSWSDVEFALGWNFLQRPHGVVGGSLRASAPVGNRPTSQYLLEPIVGSGHHWQVGVGFNAHGLIWEKDGEQHVDFIFDINIMHLFKAKQHRSFDLKENGFGSRYILAKEFDENGVYTENTQPLINITTLPCKVDAAVQVDFIALFGYQYNHFNFDIGYNGWIRTAEGIDFDCCIPKDRWGLKGIVNVANNAGPVPDTQSSATLHGNDFDEQSEVIDVPSPVFINQCDLDVRSGAASRQLTHKIFSYLGYSWGPYAQQVMPYVGLGFSVEFEGNRPKDVQPNKNSMSQWSIWLKTGAGF